MEAFCEKQLMASPVVHIPQGVKDYVFGCTAEDNVTCDWVWDVSSIRNSVDLRQYTGAIEDQKSYGSCVGNSVCSAGEYILQKNNAFIDLSRLFVYYNARRATADALAKLDIEDTGTSIYIALGQTTKAGIASEALWTYESGVNAKPSDETYFDGSKRLVGRYERCGYEHIDFMNVANTRKRNKLNDILIALHSNIPVNFGMWLHRDFFSVKGELSTHGYTRTNISPTSEGFVGGHALLIVGYDLTTKRFLIENSWGTAWGDNGYGSIPFDVILSNGFDFFVIREFAGYTMPVDDGLKITIKPTPMSVFSEFNAYIGLAESTQTKSITLVSPIIQGGTAPYMCMWSVVTMNASTDAQGQELITLSFDWQEDEAEREVTVVCLIVDSSPLTNTKEVVQTLKFKRKPRYVAPTTTTTPAPVIIPPVVIEPEPVKEPEKEQPIPEPLKPPVEPPVPNPIPPSPIPVEPPVEPVKPVPEPIPDVPVVPDVVKPEKKPKRSYALAVTALFAAIMKALKGRKK